MATSLDALLDALAEPLSRIDGLTARADEPLARHVSMGVGGPARWLATVDHADALRRLLLLLRERSIPWMMLGGGSNTIFADEGYRGVVVVLAGEFRRIEAGPGAHQLTAGAGAALTAAMNAARRRGLAGLEFAAGIPGTVGGALAGNAGTAEGELCPLAAQVETMTPDGRIERLERGQFAFGYRWSDLRERVILRAVLDLTPDAPEAIRRRIDAALAKRGEQPVGSRSSGCMFKNPPGDYAGRLIDRAGLKGLRVGAARVSERHANFFINEGQATAADLAALMAEVRRRVRERFGVELEPEVRLVGLDLPSALH